MKSSASIGKKNYCKLVNEIYNLPKRHGGGTIKMELWADDNGNMVKYSLAYINFEIFSGDNGRVLGYDNAHNYHHKHYKGEVSPVEDFTTYQNLVMRFEQELKEWIK